MCHHDTIWARCVSRHFCSLLIDKDITHSLPYHTKGRWLSQGAVLMCFFEWWHKRFFLMTANRLTVENLRDTVEITLFCFVMNGLFNVNEFRVYFFTLKETGKMECAYFYRLLCNGVSCPAVCGLWITISLTLQVGTHNEMQIRKPVFGTWFPYTLFISVRATRNSILLLSCCFYSFYFLFFCLIWGFA